MIRIFKTYKNKTNEITDICKTVTLTNSLTNVATQLSLSIHYCITDLKHTNDLINYKMQINTESFVWITLDNKEIFRGKVIDRSINNNDTLEVTAFDYAYYLKNNYITRNFNNITADKATRDILQEIGVQADNIATSNIKLRYLLAQKSVYNSIMELYSQVSKQNNKKYFVYMKGIKVNVGEMGSTLCKDIVKVATNKEVCNGNVISFTYKDTMSKMVNRVKIYDENNNYVNQVANNDYIKKFGMLQQNYVKEKDKDANVIAKNMLHGIDKEVSVEVLGNWDYRTGKAVHVKIPYISTLANALMYIISDAHTWDVETGTFTTELTLKYEKQMDFKDSDSTEKFDTKQEKKAIRAEKKKIREKKRAERKAKAQAKKKKGKKGRKKKGALSYEELLHMH